MKTHKLQFPILVPTNNRGIKNNDYCTIIKYTSFINNTDVYFQADRQTEILTVLWCALFAAKNWHGCINENNYHPHGILNLPSNLTGRIYHHRLCPLYYSLLTKVWVEREDE